MLSLLFLEMDATFTPYNVAYKKSVIVTGANMYYDSSGTSILTSANDGVITHYESSSFSEWPDYLFKIQATGAYLTIDLGSQKNIVTIMLSLRDILPSQNIGLTVSVGDTKLTSTVCYTSADGLSTWATCNNGNGISGSKIFIYNPSSDIV